MIKDQKINDFFNVFKNLKTFNPNIILNHNSLYSALIRFGVFSDDKYILSKNDIFDKIVKKDGNFEKWINRFKNSKNTFVHVDPNWNYFCQFEHGSLKYNNNGDFIKIYVPLINSRIYEGVNRIFDFIDKSGINHVSKVSSDIRFDDVVIRVTNKEDADKIINFIKNDSYIQEGLLPANPFAFNKDGLALASDGNSSYNSILSVLLTNFINNSNINELNSFNFYSYLNKLQFDLNNNYVDLKTFILTTFDKNKPSNKDFMRVLELIINSHKSTFSYDDYMKHFHAGLKTTSLNPEYILYDAIKTMTKKYELNITICALKDYIDSGNIANITRLDNLRSKIANSTFRKDMTNLMSNYNLSFASLCYKVLDKYEANYGENYDNEKKARI